MGILGGGGGLGVLGLKGLGVLGLKGLGVQAQGRIYRSRAEALRVFGCFGPLSPRASGFSGFFGSGGAGKFRS